MLNGETWLLHSSLFQGYWKVYQSPWVRSLGWVKRLHDIAKNSEGWIIVGPSNITDEDIVEIVSSPDSYNTLYQYKNGVWSYFPGPVILRFKDKIAGYMGNMLTIQEKMCENSDPWKWEGIQIIDVDAQIAVKVDIEKQAGVFQAFNAACKLVDGWMVLSTVGDVPKDALDTMINSEVICQLEKGIWLINSKEFSLANVRMAPGYDLNDLRSALEKCDAAYAWVSDTRDWPGWLPPDKYGLDKVHVWPDKYQVFGSELFVPVKRFLKETEGADTMNSFPDLVIYDKPL
jgi:hypothetical protein